MSLMSDFKAIEADIDAVVEIAKDVSGIVADGKARFAAARDALKAGLADAIASVESMADKAKSTAANTEKVVEDATDEDPPTPTQPVITTTATGARITVDPAAGTTTHEDIDHVVTTVPHDGSAPTASQAGFAQTPSDAAVAEAVQASADAGVTIPAAQ